MDSFATHLAPLVRAALACNGPILELGCGDYSTPVLAEIARARGVRLKVMTSSPQWASRYEEMAEIERLVDWRDAAFAGRWGMAFLDNEELTRDRIRHLPALAAVTDCVVVHDLEACERHPHWPHMIAPFGSLEAFRKYQPGTAILRC